MKKGWLQNDLTGAEPEYVPDEAKSDGIPVTSKERNAASGMHASGIEAALCLPIVIASAVGAMGMHAGWKLHRGQMPFVDDQAREAINFHISMSIYALAVNILFIACFVLNDGKEWIWQHISDLRAMTQDPVTFPLPVIISYIAAMGTL